MSKNFLLVMLAWSIVLLPLASCDRGEPDNTNISDSADAYLLRNRQPLPEDLEDAKSEVLRRLEEAVTISNGLIVVRDQFYEALDPDWDAIHVLPVTTPWTVTCSNKFEGLLLDLGSSIRGDEGMASNSVSVVIVQGFVSMQPGQCDVLALHVGNRFKEMIAEGSVEETRTAPGSLTPEAEFSLEMLEGVRRLIEQRMKEQED